MKKTNKLIISGIIAASMASASYAALNEPAVKPMPINNGPQARILVVQPGGHARANRFRKIKMMRKHMGNNFTHSWRRALRRSKQLTPAQVKVVAKAGVILYGDSSMQVGDITQVPAFHKEARHHNYRVQITNTEGKVLNNLLINGITGRVISPKFHHRHKGFHGKVSQAISQ